ncbi:MAG: glycosyltransferase family 87 protein [Candidatus Altiarchaeota archaeon]
MEYRPAYILRKTVSALPPSAHIYLMFYLLVVTGFGSDLLDSQNDFRKDYYAAEAYFSGGNPYRLDDALAWEQQLMPYVYPPPTLYFFRVFLLWDYDTSRYVYVTLRFISLALILYLWSKVLGEGGMGDDFIIYSVMAFNLTISVNLSTGNVSLLEQLFIWTGIYFFLRNRIVLFTASILAASVFKITPVTLLLLLLFKGDGRSLMCLASGIIIFSAYIAAPYFTSPILFNDYVGNASNAINLSFERGLMNPCNYMLTGDIANIFGLDSMTRIILYAVIVSTVLSISLAAMIRLYRAKPVGWETELVLFACIAYSFTTLHFKDYSYILLMLPAYYVIKKPEFRRVYRIVFLLTLIPMPYYDKTGTLLDLTQYHQLYLAYMAWFMYLAHIFKARKT